MRDVLAIACFALSGFAGLVYEIVWIRQATLVFGSTTLAVSSVLAVFFLGLAIGSALFGGIATRTARPLLLFALIEAAIGCLALVTPAAFELVSMLYGGLHRALGGAGQAGSWLVLARVGLVAAVLLPPTVLMGGTLPLFCRQYVVQPTRVAASVGMLYALNTLGGALGALAAGFVLLPSFGVSGTLRLGAAISLAVAILVAALRGRTRVEGESQRAPIRVPALSREHTVVLVLVMLVGFVALGSEVLWTRYFGLVIQNTVYTYTLTLGLVLFGIVLGAALIGRRSDRWGSRAAAFGALQIASGLVVLGVILVPSQVWAGFRGDRLWIYVAVLLPPAILSGASFPLAVRMVVTDPRLAGLGVGRLAAANTLGGIAGSLCLGFLALPKLGLHGSLLLTTGLGVATGCTALLLLAPGPRSRRALAVAASLGVWLVLPPALGTRLPHDLLQDLGTLVDVRAGLGANVAVFERNGLRELRINRLWQGSSRRSHQVLAAHVPLLLHPAPRRVLVIGAGAGQTPDRVLFYDVERLDCVEIEPAVFEAIRAHFSSDWMSDERVELLAEDGRNHVAHSGRSYDVISVEVGQIFRPGVPFFYTLEFYEGARKRLREGGILSQFVPLPLLTPDQLRGIVRTFTEVFPQSFLWYNTAELLLLGVETERLVLPSERLSLLTENERIHRDLAYRHWGGHENQLHHRSVFLASFLTGPLGLRAIAAGGALYTDDFPVLDYETVGVSMASMNEIPLVELIRPELEPVADYLDDSLDPEERAAIRALRAQNLGDIAAYALSRRAQALAGDGNNEQRIGLLRQAVGRNGENFLANRLLAETFANVGRFAEAAQFYRKAVQLEPNNTRARRGLARTKSALRKNDGARRVDGAHKAEPR